MKSVGKIIKVVLFSLVLLVVSVGYRLFSDKELSNDGDINSLFKSASADTPHAGPDGSDGNDGDSGCTSSDG